MSEELNRLRWRCQRGMLELDHILGGFLDRQWPRADAEQRAAFAALLAWEDADLLDLVMDRAAAPSEAMARLLPLLRRGPGD